MSLSVKEVLTYAVHVSNSVKDNEERRSHSWIRLATLNSFGFINDPRYLESNRSPEMLQEANGKRKRRVRTNCRSRRLDKPQKTGHNMQYNIKEHCKRR